MDKKRLDYLIDALNAGKISPDEQKELMLYYNSFQVNNDWDVSMGDYEETKTRIFNQVTATHHVSKIRSIRSIMVWVAASILLFCLSWFGYRTIFDMHDMVVVQTDKTAKEIVLPDGSKIMMNINSKMSYPKEFSSLRREISFEGEGYFDVAKDSTRPFIIETDMIKVKVLGTEFNLKAYKDDPKFETSLVEGKVALLTKDEKKTLSVLAPNQKFVAEHEDLSRDLKSEVKMSVAPLEYIGGNQEEPVDLAWKDGKLAFHSATLLDIVRMLKRKYDVDIKVVNEPIAASRFTGAFEGESLEDILSALRISKDFNYRKEGNAIIIY